MTQGRIQNIILDLGNVIIDLDIARTEQMLASFSSIPYDGYHEKAGRLFLQYETGAISEELFINGLIRESKPGTQAQDIINAWNAMLIDIPDHRISLIHELSERYRVYILSNTNTLHERRFNQILRERHSLNALSDLPVHGVYFSHRIGHRKPDRACFLKVMEDAGIRGDRSLFIDDHLANVRGGLAAGLLSVHKLPNIDFNRFYVRRLGLL